MIGLLIGRGIVELRLGPNKSVARVVPYVGAMQPTRALAGNFDLGMHVPLSRRVE